MIFPAIEEMRLPIEYLANLFTAGKVEPVKKRYKNGNDEKLYACSSHKQTI